MADTIVQDIALRSCEDLEEMLNEAQNILQQHDNWKSFFYDELERKRLSINKFARVCGVSYNTVKKWTEGTLPKSRNNFIKIGLGLRYQVREINHMLNRYGKYSSLYPKSWEDAICIFTINAYLDDVSVNLVKKYEELVLKYQMFFVTTKDVSNPGEKMLGTATLTNELGNMKNEQVFDEFMKNHTISFADSYGKLVKFIDDFIAAVDDRKELQIIGSNTATTKNVFWEDQDVAASSVYKRNKRFKVICDTQLSRLRRHRELPTRKNLIILGIYLDMGLEEVNILLSLANMEPLCPKDTVECFLIYTLMTVDVYRPEYMVEHAVKLRKTGNKEWKEYCDDFLKYYESGYDTNDYDAKIDAVGESVADYVSSVLIAIAEKQPEYDEYVEEYIQFLIPDGVV